MRAWFLVDVTIENCRNSSGIDGLWLFVPAEMCIDILPVLSNYSVTFNQPKLFRKYPPIRVSNLIYVITYPEMIVGRQNYPEAVRALSNGRHQE